MLWSSNWFASIFEIFSMEVCAKSVSQLEASDNGSPRSPEYLTYLELKTVCHIKIFFDETGCYWDCPKSGRPRSARTEILKDDKSRQFEKNGQTNSSKMARNDEVARMTMLLKEDLGTKIICSEKRPAID